MLALAAITFMSVQSFAAERQFRVNTNMITSDGYAIAWGAKGKSLDFEKIEADEQATSDLVGKETLVNYLVDLKTDSILVQLSDPANDSVIGLIRDRTLGNHFSLGAVSVQSEGVSDQDLVLTTESWKLNDSIAHIFLIKRNYGSTQVIDDCIKCGADINTQIEAKLTAKQKKELKDLGANYFSLLKSVPLSPAPGAQHVLKIVDHRYVAKGEQRGYVVTSLVRVSIANDKVAVNVEKVTVRPDAK